MRPENIHASSDERPPPTGFAHITCVAIAALLLIPLLTSAQEVTQPALKAAFIYNFAKFTEWPGGGPPITAPFVFCVTGNADVAQALDKVVKDRLLGGHNIIVSLVPEAGPHHLCQVLYVTGLPAEGVSRIVARVRDLPVLTVSDIEDFGQLGGIAQLFFEDGQLRFRIRDELAKRAHLQIRANLLILGKRK